MGATTAKTFSDATLYIVQLKKTVYKSTAIGDDSPVMDIHDEQQITLNLVLPYAKQTPTSKLAPVSAAIAARRIDEWVKNNTTERVDYELLSFETQAETNIITVIHS